MPEQADKAQFTKLMDDNGTFPFRAQDFAQPKLASTGLHSVGKKVVNRAPGRNAPDVA